MKLRMLRWATPVLTLAFGAALTVAPLSAHHSWSAEFDEKKPLTLKGVVSKVEWNNPHVFIFMDVTEKGAYSNWGVEFASTSELKGAGWTRDSVKVGDTITVNGDVARDGSTLLGGKTLTLPSGKKLSSVFSNIADRCRPRECRPRRLPSGPTAIRALDPSPASAAIGRIPALAVCMKPAWAISA